MFRIYVKHTEMHFMETEMLTHIWSTCSWRVRICIDLRKSALLQFRPQHRQAYTALHRRSRIAAKVIGWVVEPVL